MDAGTGWAPGTRRPPEFGKGAQAVLVGGPCAAKLAPEKTLEEMTQAFVWLREGAGLGVRLSEHAA